MNYEERREIDEALYAAEDAIAHLRGAREALDSARNWGFVDIMGGGLVSTVVKHSKMRGAKGELYEAKEAVERFGKELLDVPGIQDMDIEVDDFLSFADIVFDGLLADWMVQSRIDESRDNVDAAIREIQLIKRQLRARL